MSHAAFDIDLVDNIAQALAMTLIFTINKRQIIVVSCDKNNISAAKDFFKKIICSEEVFCTPVIDKDYDIKQFKSKKFKDGLCKLKYTKSRAVFINNFEEKISRDVKYNLTQVMQKSNVQIIIFQTLRNVDYISIDDLIHINLSDWRPEDNINALGEVGALWAKLYLSVYGLHLLFKARKNEFRFSLAEDTIESEDAVSAEEQQKMIEKISKEFIKRCFVSRKIAEKRATERRNEISKIRKDNKNVSDDTIREILSKKPLFSTYVGEFLIYANVYLETQYPRSLISKYNITSQTIANYIRTDDKLQKEFPCTPLNIRHTEYTNNPDVADKPLDFDKLSLKETWNVMEVKLRATNVNTITEIDEGIQKKLHKLFEVLPKTIDFKPLSHFASANMNIRIEGLNGENSNESP